MAGPRQGDEDQWMGKDEVMPVRPADERRAPAGRGSSGFGRTLSQSAQNAKETTGMVTPTRPADERRVPSQQSDGIEQMARGMAGSTRREQMRPGQPLKPERRQRGDRPG